MMTQSLSERAADLYTKLVQAAESMGYHINPDREFTVELLAGMLTNEDRYGYRSCPCRMADGDMEADRDIICPCDYRDPDLEEYGQCYCALYVSDAVVAGDQSTCNIPERRHK